MCDRCETLKQTGLFERFEAEKEKLQGELDARIEKAQDAYKAAVAPFEKAYHEAEDAAMDEADARRVELWGKYDKLVREAGGPPLFTAEELGPRPPYAEQRKARAEAQARLEALFRGLEAGGPVEDEGGEGGIIITG